MYRSRRRPPELTPEQLANPYTRLRINGLEVQLWQVAHFYNVSFEMPRVIRRCGATASDIRALYPRQHDNGIASTSISAEGSGARPATENHTPHNALIPLATVLASQGVRHPESRGGQRSETGAIPSSESQVIPSPEPQAIPSPESQVIPSSESQVISPPESQAIPFSQLQRIPSSEAMGTQASDTQENPEDAVGTQDLIRLIDELVDEAWQDGSVEEEGGHTTSAPVGPSPATTSNAGPADLLNTVLWADPSFPPPLYPPLNRPLPPIPPRPVGSRHPGRRHRSTSAMSAGAARPLQGNGSRRNLDIDRDMDEESERTITPATSRQQLVARPRPQAVPMPTPRATDEQPAPIQAAASRQQLVARPHPQAVEMPTLRATEEQPVPTHAAARAPQQIPPMPRRQAPVPTSKAPVQRPEPKQAAGPAAEPASSASILRNRDREGDHLHQKKAGPVEPWPKLPPTIFPHPLPSFLQSPPSFLQHPPDFSQSPDHDQSSSRLGRLRAKSSSSVAAWPSKPVTPTPRDSDPALTSRWSPESSPEESTLKKVKRVLSFAKLRSRKSSVFRQQTEDQASESSAPIAKRSSGSSGSGRSASMGGNYLTGH